MSRALDGPDGLIAALERSEAEVRHLERQEQFEEVRIALLCAREHHQYLVHDVGCAQRLMNDPRMQAVYALLAQELENEDQRSGFIKAAWAAHKDYSQYRDGVRAANELAREVAKAAGALADQLRRAEHMAGPLLPDEFFSITSLLRHTEHEGDHRNYGMWRGLRGHILGDLEQTLGERDRSDATQNSPPLEKVEVVLVSLEPTPVDPEVEMRNLLRYAWATAPSMARIIASIEAAAKNYAAAETGHVAAAIDSRKRNAKAEYLRAFADLLADEPPISRTPPIINAMAITATVALNHPDDVATAADVRSALARPAA